MVGSWYTVVIVRACSIAWLRFTKNLSSGTHWFPGIPVTVNPIMGALMCRWETTILATIPIKFSVTATAIPFVVSAKVPAFVTEFATCISSFLDSGDLVGIDGGIC